MLKRLQTIYCRLNRIDRVVDKERAVGCSPARETEKSRENNFTDFTLPKLSLIGQGGLFFGCIGKRLFLYLRK